MKKITGNRWYHQCFQGWEWGDLLAFKGSNHNRSNLRKKPLQELLRKELKGYSKKKKRNRK